jgi:hypothetical protein
MAVPEAFPLSPTLIDELADRLSDAIAQRVVAALRDGSIQQAHTTISWIDAQEVALQLGVSRDWVYEHADQLGASRIGRGPRPRLRFPPDILERQGDNRPSPEPANHPAKQHPKSSGLIPIRGS